ncbi:hypothetical protein [Prauserella rugosa]|uniref:Anti-sigma-M factor RsmA n=1 Tax=Prauserella rugosa TaxID=43354 RepID=A0A660CJ85_9PSEU|nr:hypothetical protein [Prauserella rugosa]KMS82744.1 hypothetical protein ACZ91_57090 [Streptomyces regensis]TWH21683.1 hypothetical protein JD82_03549 [Prauserella rugosa]
MNGEFTDRDGSALSVDVLADLHAGVLSESEAAELWPRVNADPEARAVIEALEATTSDLSSLTDEPVEPMPADVAARLDAAIAGEQRAREQQGTTNVVGLDRARSRRKKQAGWAAGFVAVAAAAVAAVAVVLPGAGGGDSTPGVAEPAPSEPAPSQPNSQPDSGTGDGPLALSSDRGELSAAVNDINQVRDFGTLQTKERLDSCVAEAGIDPSKQPVGVRPVTIDGQEAIMVLYTTGELAQFRMVAVSPDCGPQPVLNEIVGRN